MQAIREILESEDDVVISNKPLGIAPKDIRAWHCKTASELALWKYSSNYQTYRGGVCDLQTETGVDVESTTYSE